MINCEPKQMAIWIEIRVESGIKIATVLEGVLLERCPITEVLMNSSTTFCSAGLKEMLKWSVRRFFRAAYRQSRNGIVTNHHRTIKAVAEKNQISPEEVVF